MRKLFLVLLTFVTVVITAQTLVIKGSNTVYPIAQLWVEAFKKLYPNVTVTLEGAGSTTGIKALFNETTDIANSSRFLKPEEVDEMHKSGRYFVPIIIAYDGLSVIVHPSLPIEDISIDTLRKIYTGEITEWSQVDPKLPKRPIVVYSRNTASGTFETWVEKVLKGAKLSPTVQMLESSQAEIESVAVNPYAIGYTGMGYVTKQVKALKVNGIAPTVENVLAGIYPISRPLFMFIDLKRFNNTWPDKGVVADYLRFVLSPKGQKLVREAGYIPAYGAE
ncbi:phosphate ABC transporter substrate-binding protein PstS [Pseudothermotoga sp.]|uniref:phosphate ABC transporter substrate-binding protein PstS n=1 Tax=Pseudothermotoga sp. TaxID=2033661 RepID=UPI0031F6F5C8